MLVVGLNRHGLFPCTIGRTEIRTVRCPQTPTVTLALNGWFCFIDDSNNEDESNSNFPLLGYTSETIRMTMQGWSARGREMEKFCCLFTTIRGICYHLLV
jgi:hypothetical protein